jgi:DASS family divalent anion:Na+ symporter
MFVPGILCLVVMPLVIYLIYPPDVKVTPDAKGFAKDNLADMGSISRQEKIMLGVFGLMLLLWANIPALLLGEQYSVDATTTAFIGLTTLILTGVLTWEDILKEKSAWDTIIWFGALIMMAAYLNELGLIRWFSDNIEAMIGTTGLGWVGAVAILTLVYLYIHYFFASTTAHITALFAAFYVVGLSLGAPPMLYALILAAAGNIMMTLTHYATGTAPVIFNSGYVTLKEWWGIGAIMSVVNLVIWIGAGMIWWKVLGYY